MDPNFAPMLLGMTIVVVTGAVLLLRPISKRLGSYLEALASEKRAPRPLLEPQIRDTLDRIEERLRLIEERQDFTDALLRRETPRAELPPRTRPPAEG